MQQTLKDAALRKNDSRPPVWFMRQAGRYHSHYQEIRKRHSFTDICKVPEIACETTMGPIQDFDFDAAILFSDILFPLEVMGIPVTYDPAPQLAWLLRHFKDLAKLTGGKDKATELTFQADALKLIRTKLPKEKALIGFVGAPLTLYAFAVDGSHKQSLESSKQGFLDGRFHGFCEKLVPLLAENMILQAQAGADVMAVFDTCAGDFPLDLYRDEIVPVLAQVLKRFREACPNTPLIYYAKGVGREHWHALKELPIDCLGIDWRHDLAHVIDEFGGRFAIQGNLDPTLLRDLDQKQLSSYLRDFFKPISQLAPEKRRGWICGLGHGILPKTPEENVHLFLRMQKEVFA